MKVHPQFITTGGVPSFVVLPYDEFALLSSKLEDLEDIEAVELAGLDDAERFPLDLVESIAAGANPIRVFREYRGYSQNKLAKLSGLSRQFIFQLESDQRKCSVDSLKKIAAALKVAVDDIV